MAAYDICGTYWYIMRCEGSLRPISWSPIESRHVKVWPKLTNFPKKSILRHLEAFFGHSEENKKVLELNFTPENTSGWVFLVHFDRFSKNIFAKNIFFLKKISGINQGWSDESPLKIWAWLDVRNPGAFITIECVTVWRRHHWSNSSLTLLTTHTSQLLRQHLS